MTGRRLYDHHTAARKETIGTRPVGAYTGFREHHAPVAWDYLGHTEQSFWNNLARRITPKKRSA